MYSSYIKSFKRVVKWADESQSSQEMIFVFHKSFQIAAANKHICLGSVILEPFMPIGRPRTSYGWYRLEVGGLGQEELR